MKTLLMIMIWVQLESIPVNVDQFKVYWGPTSDTTANSVVIDAATVGADKRLNFDIDTLAEPRTVSVSGVNSFGEGARSNEFPTGLPSALVIEGAGA